RDPDSRVFYADGRVLRALSERGLADWEALAASDLFRQAVADGRVVATEPVEDGSGLPAELAEAGYTAVLAHERVPFVSYPYEWSFGMLKDAALLQLELLSAALDEGLVLKDATPYNVQWRGSRPVFVDVGSFERLRPGEPWAGYRQFCMLFLYPLLLQAYRGVGFQPRLRGSLEGITPAECRSLLGVRDRFRRGVIAHVVLHARLERRHADRRRDVKRELRAAGFHEGLIRANVRGLEKLVRRLRWEPGRSEWSGYREENPYTDADATAKEAFVRTTAASRTRRLAWDIGCNDGRYTRIAAEGADYVVALDADAAVIELLYRALREEGSRTILPLVADVADPSPGLGWRGRERVMLEERGRPELTLCLALVHHVAISGNVPVRAFLEWLRSLESELVIELPTRDDPMVQRLLAGKSPDANPDYGTESFERALAEDWEVARREVLPSGTRILYRATPRA
ncbi:MAG TPA: class I SAM-dependent methyltransferase, partial [Gaiellaceae bacterium]|nr:class I SAM-dependent methyltransferase [Gaiellaceae bacterium]